MSKYSVSDDCLDPQSGVLKNKLGIQDEKTLELAEADYAAARSFELWQSPITPPFSPESLKTINKRLFGDVYEWAGTYRTIDISKGASRFANWNHIGASLDKLFSELRAEKALQGMEAADFSKRAAYYMAELNAIHPFREGNGRTQREFINQLAYANGLGINWKAIEPPAILEATIQSFSWAAGGARKVDTEKPDETVVSILFQFRSFQTPTRTQRVPLIGALWFFRT